MCSLDDKTVWSLSQILSIISNVLPLHGARVIGVYPAVIPAFCLFLCEYKFNTFISVGLTYKSLSLFEFLFRSWPESQSASVPYSGVRPPCPGGNIDKV